MTIPIPGVALAIDRYMRWIGAVYAFDLVGTGLGALVIVHILWLSPAPPLVVVLGVLEGMASLLVSVSADEAAKERAEGLLFVPGSPYKNAWAELARAPSLQRFCDGYRLDVCLPTDDKPTSGT